VTPWSSEPIGDQHDLTRFAGGNHTLDAWLRDQALRAHRAGAAANCCWTRSSGSVPQASCVGGHVIAVDAIDDDAARFYIHHRFQPIAGSSRRVMKVATARAAFAGSTDKSRG
jgi:hypothetical protein